MYERPRAVHAANVRVVVCVCVCIVLCVFSLVFDQISYPRWMGMSWLIHIN